MATTRNRKVSPNSKKEVLKALSTSSSIQGAFILYSKAIRIQISPAATVIGTLLWYFANLLSCSSQTTVA